MWHKCITLLLNISAMSSNIMYMHLHSVSVYCILNLYINPLVRFIFKKASSVNLHSYLSVPSSATLWVRFPSRENVQKRCVFTSNFTIELSSRF